jgi:hypothetical protein
MDLYTVNSGAVSLSAATVKTVLQIATPASTRAKLTSFSVSFNSVTSSDAPAVVDLLRQTTAGTGGSSATLAPLDPDAPASQLTGLFNIASAEPSAGNVLWSGYVTPVGGLFVYNFAEGEEPILDVSNRIGIRVNSPAAVSAIATLTYAE